MIDVSEKELEKKLYTLSSSFTPGVFQDFVENVFKSEILWEKAKIKSLLNEE